MKKFNQGILVFAMVLFSIAFMMDVLISNGLKRTERGHFYTMNALMNQEINADLLILGNSRAACSYHTMVLDTILKVDSRNLGVSGQPFGVSYLRWCLYKRKNLNPKLLIVNIDYAELNMVINGYEKEQYYPYLCDTMVQPYLDLYGFSWAEKHLPMYRYRGNYKLMGLGLAELLHVYHDTKGDFLKGYANADAKWNGEAFEEVIREGKVKGEVDGQAVKLLEQLLETARQEHFKVVFVYAPMYGKLKEHLEEEQPMAVYHDLSERYEVPILDFSNMGLCGDTGYFKDANHVNFKGAEYFSTTLARRIDSLGFCRGR